jgi:hypothetical protein
MACISTAWGISLSGIQMNSVGVVGDAQKPQAMMRCNLAGVLHDCAICSRASLDLHKQPINPNPIPKLEVIAIP